MGLYDRVSTGSRRMGEDADAMRDIGFPTRPAGLEEQAGQSTSRVKRTFLDMGLSPTHRRDTE